VLIGGHIISIIIDIFHFEAVSPTTAMSGERGNYSQFPVGLALKSREAADGGEQATIYLIKGSARFGATEKGYSALVLCKRVNEWRD